MSRDIESEEHWKQNLSCGEKLHSCEKDKEDPKSGCEGVRRGVGWIPATQSGFYFRLETL